MVEGNNIKVPSDRMKDKRKKIYRLTPVQTFVDIQHSSLYVMFTKKF